MRSSFFVVFFSVTSRLVHDLIHLVDLVHELCQSLLIYIISPPTRSSPHPHHFTDVISLNTPGHAASIFNIDSLKIHRHCSRVRDLNLILVSGSTRGSRSSLGSLQEYPTRFTSSPVRVQCNHIRIRSLVVPTRQLADDFEREAPHQRARLSLLSQSTLSNQPRISLDEISAQTHPDSFQIDRIQVQLSLN